MPVATGSAADRVGGSGVSADYFNSLRLFRAAYLGRPVLRDERAETCHGQIAEEP
jgi:hypothetical protein